jgi:hypothetical protein
MSYTQYTQATFTADLAQMLSDPTHVYWAQDELNRVLNEALLLWGALTSYWTTRSTFPTAAGVPFYDLNAQFPNLRARKYTFDDLTKEIQYHLYEPANGVTGTGMTDQFTIGQITSALARRRNEFVIDSRIPLTFTTIPAPAPPANQVTLSQSVALIARAAWIEAASGIVTPLRRTDSYAAQSYSPYWNLNPAKPYGYSQVEAMPGTMVLIPPPINAGSIHLTYAQTLQLSIAGGTSFQVPDELVMALKYGALNDILCTNAQGFDPIRAKYCEERYDSLIELAALHRSIIQVRLGNALLPLDTLISLDAHKPFWQTGTGTPQIAVCAYDILAFHKVPGSAYTITCDLVQSAPLPQLPNDFIQLGPEEIPYIFDYCRHVLQLKLGGVEFVQSMPLYDNFQKGAQQRSKLIQYKARYLTPLFSQPRREEQEAPAA